jgi:hypothetical protein
VSSWGDPVGTMTSEYVRSEIALMIQQICKGWMAMAIEMAMVMCGGGVQWLSESIMLLHWRFHDFFGDVVLGFKMMQR